jgi:hypothetical protein
MTREQIAAFIQSMLERETREAKRLDDCEYDHEFSARVRMLVDDLTMLTDRFEQMVDTYYAVQPGLYSFTVYREPADTNEPKRRIGTVKADTAVQAIERAAQLYEMSPDDIVVTQIIEAPETLELPLPSNYQPQTGDTYILKLWVDQFDVRRYNGTEWVKIQHFFSSEQDVTIFILSGMQYLGSSRNHRHYYRPQPEEENKQS